MLKDHLLTHLKSRPMSARTLALKMSTTFDAVLGGLEQLIVEGEIKVIQMQDKMLYAAIKKAQEATDESKGETDAGACTLDFKPPKSVDITKFRHESDKKSDLMGWREWTQILDEDTQTTRKVRMPR